MKTVKKEILSKIFSCVIAVLIPLLLLVLGIQSKKYSELSIIQWFLKWLKRK